MNLGICKLCLQRRPLAESHALPNSVFNYILRRNSGKAIVITDDTNTPARSSSDSWHVELLCVPCERKLNTEYDAYGMAVFRGHKGSVRVHGAGVDLLNIERRRLRMFFLSIVWRISVSTHPQYSNIDLPLDWEEEIRGALEKGRSLPDRNYIVAVYKMRDSTARGGFSNENLRGFIAAPFARDYGSFVSVCFTFLGFFVEAFFPRIPESFAKRSGVLQGRSPVLSIPYIEVLDIPEITNVLVSALRKEIQPKGIRR